MESAEWTAKNLKSSKWFDELQSCRDVKALQISP